jgi:hypothetical protein
MAAGTRHRISNLRTAPGELSFEARVAGDPKRVWLRTETEVVPNADAALAACLLPAMVSGGTLRIEEPLSPRLLRTQREYQAIQRAWSLGWNFVSEPLREVRVLAPTREPETRPPSGRVAAFFSGGVDSWATVLENPDLTDLVFVRGLDLIPGAEKHRGLAEEVERRLAEAAAGLGLDFHRVETNLRELSDPLIAWDAIFGCAAAAVALFLAPLFDRVLISGDSDYEVQEKFGANWLVDQLFSTEQLEIVDSGGQRSRMERLRSIAGHPLVGTTLRVCWENPDGAYNCGRCRKCLMTMAGLEAIGAREAVSTFPPELDLGAVESVEITQPVHLTLWEDLLDAARENGKEDLELALGEAVARGKARLGLPPTYRRRARAGGGGRSGFFATAETARAIAAAERIAVLVGGYDGSGNFGDLVQLDAAAELLGALEGELLLLPVLERGFAESHAAIGGNLLHPAEHAVYFDDGSGPGEDGLVPVEPPAQLAEGVSYLYGGGFLNPDWGERKLGMLTAAESLLEGAASVRRVSSGLQVDGEWLWALPPERRRQLSAYAPLGARDAASREALAALGNGRSLETADDAVAILGRLGPPAPAASGKALIVNLHFAAHDWVTGRPDAMLEFYAGFLAELADRAGGGVLARPWIAYLDQRIDERPGLERLAAACAGRGVAVEEPRPLIPAELATQAAELRAAVLTLSCSYHVALMSLMVEVPAVLIEDNAYYSQKAAGLAEAFGRSPAFTPTAAADPARCAEAVATLLDPERSAAARKRLASGGEELRRRRRTAEEELLRELRGGGAAGGHRISNLRTAPGELSFEARVAGDPKRVWLRTETEVVPNADAALAACLLPAMVSGGTLRIEEPLSPRLLRTQREYQAIQRAWSLGWNFVSEPLREVRVLAPTREPETRPPSGRVAAFFSGGVDSWATVLENPDLTDLVFVRGLDLIPGAEKHRGLAEEVERRLRWAAGRLGLPLHVVETNVRELSDPLLPWDAYNPGALAAVALFLAPLFDRVLIASDSDHETQVPLGTSRMIDQLWSTETLEVCDDGGRLRREERLRRVAAHPLARETLRVCWENPDGAYNCGRCRKCMLTMISLEAFGMRHEVTTFPPDLDLGLLAAYEISSPIQLVLWEDALETTRRMERPDLERAVAPVVAGGKRAMGLPDSYRVRSRRSPPEGGSQGGHDDELLRTRQRLEEVLGSSSWRLTAPLRRLRAWRGRR